MASSSGKSALTQPKLRETILNGILDADVQTVSIHGLHQLPTGRRDSKPGQWD